MRQNFRIYLVLAALPLLFLPAAPSLAKEPETVCILCHDALPGKLGEPVKLWKDSVHAANGISCHSCHGGDPTDMAMAMSKERGFLGKPAQAAIPAFCGRCHVGVKEDYLASAHGRALDRGGPHCVTCHGNHAVRKASPDLINLQSCTRCHDYGRAEEIRSAVVETDRRISELERSLAALHRIGIVTKEMDDELFALRNRFHRLFHNVDVEKVRRETAGFQAELVKVRERVAAVEAELKRRKFWGGGVVALLVCCGVLALLIFRSYREER
jgi:Cytochrome c3